MKCYTSIQDLIISYISEEPAEIFHHSTTLVPYYDLVMHEEPLSPSEEPEPDSPRKASSFIQSTSLTEETTCEEVKEPNSDSPVIPKLNNYTPFFNMKETSEILSIQKMWSLWEQLPPYLQSRNWKLAYSPKSHGTSLQAFMRCASEMTQSILVIKDQDGFVFGGFASDSWNFNRIYYGTGDCFLFSFKDGEDLKCYFPTGKNDYYMMADHESIVMGGG